MLKRAEGAGASAPVGDTRLMIQAHIAQIERPSIFRKKDWFTVARKAMLKCAGPKWTFNWKEFDKRPLPIRVSLAFFLWHSDVNEIVDSVNIALSDLYDLEHHTNMSAKELWLRYRLLTRTAIYESHRLYDVTRKFFADLQRIGLG